MIVSRRRYFCNLWYALLVISIILLLVVPIANDYLYHISKLNTVCQIALVCEVVILLLVLTVRIIISGGFASYINRRLIIRSLETNLISIGAYDKKVKNYVITPHIRIKNGMITILLSNLRIRTIIERYLNSFSTALPERYVVEDYYITQNNTEVVILYSDSKNYKCEAYSIENYIAKVHKTEDSELYFDKKHTVDVHDYPHFLISGSSGSGKSYLVNELVIQAIVKKWQVVILDLKRSYGLYRAYTDYCYELDDIISKLAEIESEMFLRMEKLQPVLDNNPQALAVDIGYRPMLVIIEEYISLQSSLSKNKKEELERIVKNISVLARQSSIHLMIVMQSAGTENIQATTRSNLTKVLLGNAQSNILTATFGTGVDLPKLNTRMNKGEGLIQLDRISVLRVPRINNIDEFKDVVF